MYQIVAFLREVKLQSLEMKPYLEEYDPADIPTEVQPTPPPHTVEGAELISSIDQELAARLAAGIAGGNLLHIQRGQNSIEKDMALKIPSLLGFVFLNQYA